MQVLVPREQASKQDDVMDQVKKISAQMRTQGDNLNARLDTLESDITERMASAVKQHTDQIKDQIEALKQQIDAMAPARK